MKQNIVVTTNVKSNETLENLAKKIAEKLNIKYEKRKKMTIKQLQTKYNGVLVVYKEKLCYYEGEEKLFFHPDTAVLRIKKPDNEPLVDIIGDAPKNVLDATMGLASDSIVLSYYGYNVVAIEKNDLIYNIVDYGLKNYKDVDEKILLAMRKIKTINEDNLTYMKKCANNSFDIVYLDPMFSENIKESTNLVGVEKVADYSRISEELLSEAKRIAREKIIVKAHFRDSVFEDFGLTRIVRKNTKFHFGYININNNS